jgi:hypothetical protein
MTIWPSSPPAKEPVSKAEGTAGGTSLTANRDGAEFAVLLSRVRSELSTAECADKVDAEQWLRTWLDTPNVAFGNKRPRSLLKQARTGERAEAAGLSGNGKIHPATQQTR